MLGPLDRESTDLGGEPLYVGVQGEIAAELRRGRPHTRAHEQPQRLDGAARGDDGFRAHLAGRSPAFVGEKGGPPTPVARPD